VEIIKTKFSWKALTDKISVLGRCDNQENNAEKDSIKNKK
jgi:hypothetical protein